MNILLNGNKKYLTVLIIILISISTFSETILTPDPHLSISTMGFITGKFQELDIYKSGSDLNNHGAFYGEVKPELYFNKSNFLSLGFIVMNEEFSELEDFALSPLIYANIGNWETVSSIKWNIKSGYLPYTTIGCGLTIKDFRHIGTQASLSVEGLNSMVTIWAQGYTRQEDLYWLRVFHEKFPVKLNVFVWNIQGKSEYQFNSNEYYISIYGIRSVIPCPPRSVVIFSIR